MKSDDVETLENAKARAKVRLGVRSFFYAVYAGVVWFGVGRFVREFWTSRGAWVDVSAIQAALSCVAAASVLGGLATFAAAAFWRSREKIGVEEPFCGIVGRTGVPIFALVCVVGVCDSSVERPVLLAALAGYFLTAPVAFWATFPPKNRCER